MANNLSEKNKIDNSKDTADNTNIVTTIDNATQKTNKIDKTSQDVPSSNFIPVERKTKKLLSSSVIIFIIALLIISAIFVIYNTLNSNIISGIQIKGIDVSSISKSDARYKVDSYIDSTLVDELTLKYGDFESTISLSQIEATFDTKTASNSAYNIGRQGNIFQNNLYILSTLFGKINIEPMLRINREQLIKNLEDISTQLPDSVIQSSYYIENNNLVVTSGQEGNIINIDATIESIRNSISDFSYINKPVDIIVKNEQPDNIDISKIHSQIYKEPVDAYFTTEPFAVFPSENGINFNISIEEAHSIITSEKKDEYLIPLKTLYPNVTTNMIGTEAFPHQLSSYSTRYAVNNTNRTTNLILASNKINGTVIMPGEIFSYNKVVGQRTIAARI